MQKGHFFENIRRKLLNAQVFRFIFLGILAILIFVFFVQLFTTKGASVGPLFFQDTNDTFMDFFNVQKSISNMAPVSEGIYPPLSYIMLLPFHYFVDYGSVDALTARSLQAGIMSLIVFFVVWIFFSAVFLSKIMPKHPRQNMIFVFLLLLSAPMIFLLERGNINLVTLGFIAVYFVYYKDKSPALREIAIIALAIATAIKLYPALFGLLLFKKDTFRSFFRLAVYCILLIVFPVFLFKGGLDSIKSIAGNILNFSNTIENWPDSVALRSFLGYRAMFRAAGIKLGMDWLQQAAHYISYVMLAGSIAGAFFVDRTWKKAALLACPIIMFPAMSSIYNLVYLFIPIILFLKIEEDRKWTDYVYMALFLILLNPVQLGNWIPMVAKTTIFSNISMVIINSMLCIEGLVGLVKLLAVKSRQKAPIIKALKETGQAEPVNEVFEDQ